MLLTDPSLALRWLHRARRGVIAVEIVVIGLAEFGQGLHFHSPALLALLAGWAAIDALQSLLVPPRPAGVLAHAALDLGLLTMALGLSGGPSNPLTSAYLVYLAVLAIVLAPRWTVAAVLTAIGLQSIAVLESSARGRLVEELPTGHLLGHILAFDLAAIAIAWFVSRVSAALHEREEAERQAARHRATTDRLAALGRLAAGVAHELGTPLGTIQLAVEQLRATGSPADLALVEEQVLRCRALLERLRGRETDPDGTCELELGGWAKEWARGSPGLEIEVRAPYAPRVAGGEDVWRAALWTALDNARIAGARHVVVELRGDAERVEVAVEDDGSGLGTDTAAHAGEPFRSGWGGTGLGLFVARNFAQSVGGDVALEARERGARVRLTMTRVSG